jgi:hypothetical protein
VRVNNVTAKRLLSTNTAVVRTLRTGEPTNGPAERPVDILLQEGVLLLNAVPWLLGRNSGVAKDLSSGISLVGGDWLSSWGVAIAHDLQVVRI